MKSKLTVYHSKACSINFANGALTSNRGSSQNRDNWRATQSAKKRMADEIGEVMDSMVKEFCDVTDATPQVAKLFIRKSNFILQEAIFDFFEKGNKEIDSIEISDEDAEITEKDASSAKKSFKLLTWNIDGLDEQDLKLRTLAVIFQINSLSPDAVYLQEVVPETLELIRRMCKG